MENNRESEMLGNKNRRGRKTETTRQQAGNDEVLRGVVWCVGSEWNGMAV